MSGQHTPGPWVVANEDGCTQLRAPSDDGLSRYKTLMCDMTYYPWINFTDADWRLVAAAPELLGALKGYMDAVNTMNAAMKDGLNVHGAISGLIGAEDNAKAAIAKASPTTTDAGVVG